MIKLEKVIDARTKRIVDIKGMDELEEELFESARRTGFGKFINTLTTLMENRFYYRETVGSNFAREPKGVTVTAPVITKESSDLEVIEFPFVIKDAIDGFVVFKNGHICPITLNDGGSEVVALETVLFEYSRQPVTRQADASYGIMVMGEDLEESINEHNKSAGMAFKDSNYIVAYFLHEEEK